MRVTFEARWVASEKYQAAFNLDYFLKDNPSLSALGAALDAMDSTSLGIDNNLKLGADGSLTAREGDFVVTITKTQLFSRLSRILTLSPGRTHGTMIIHT